MNNGHKAFTSITLLFLLAVFCIAVYPRFGVYHQLPFVAYAFMIGWLSIAILFCCISYKDFVTGFLISLFSTLVSCRIAAIYNIESIMLPMIFVFLCYLSNFIYCAAMHVKH